MFCGWWMPRFLKYWYIFRTNPVPVPKHFRLLSKALSQELVQVLENYLNPFSFYFFPPRQKTPYKSKPANRRIYLSTKCRLRVVVPVIDSLYWGHQPMVMNLSVSYLNHEGTSIALISSENPQVTVISPGEYRLYPIETNILHSPNRSTYEHEIPVLSLLPWLGIAVQTFWW